MTYRELILMEISAGRNSKQMICESQRTLMPSDVRRVIRRMLYAGDIAIISHGRYRIK